jgi:ribosomal protein S27AE
MQGANIVCAQCGASVAQAETVFAPDGRLVCTRCHSLRAAHEQIERGREAQDREAHRMGGGIVSGVVAAALMDRAEDPAASHAEVNAMATNRAAPDAVRCSRCGAFAARAETTFGPGGLLCAGCSTPVRSNDAPDELEVYLARRRNRRRVALIVFGSSLVVVPLLAFTLGRLGILPRDTLSGVLVVEFLLGAGMVRALLIRVTDSV